VDPSRLASGAETEDAPMDQSARTLFAVVRRLAEERDGPVGVAREAGEAPAGRFALAAEREGSSSRLPVSLADTIDVDESPILLSLGGAEPVIARILLAVERQQEIGKGRPSPTAESGELDLSL